MKLLLKNWHSDFIDLCKSASSIKIITPFIRHEVIYELKQYVNFKDIEIITRFKLADFHSGVSSLEALEKAYQYGASIYGLKKLHSKVYIFDNNSAIVTSSNLSESGLKYNEECGVLINDGPIVNQLIEHFDSLKTLSTFIESKKELKKWRSILKNAGEFNSPAPSLPDFGASHITLPTNKRYFVKFLGAAKNRVELDFGTREEVQRGLIHHVCGFSREKKPRQFRDGDIVYLARMVKNPNDFSVFGKAEAVKFKDGRDEASENEIKARGWRKDLPIYLRVNNPIFIDGSMRDGVFLYDIIKHIDYNAFASTLRRYKKGERNIRPKNSLSQQAYIELTYEGALWIEERLQVKFDEIGTIPDKYLKSIPPPVDFKAM